MWYGAINKAFSFDETVAMSTGRKVWRIIHSGFVKDSLRSWTSEALPEPLDHQAPES